MILTDPAGLFDALRALDLPLGHWVVCGSAPLYARGLRSRLHDLDILACGLAWQRALTIAPPRPAESGLGLAIHHPEAAIEVFDTWPAVDCADVIDRADLIDGIPLLTLDDTAHWKATAARPKDAADVEAIRNLQSRWQG
ncbi:hypothetical protein ACIOJE_27180 [Kitasatospora sp. NPDC087861]|uniref:hypothetical protein n=1 Tax=Kitasatospora sp. NPDC087861 TaxID=3364070 RepID=UPI00381B480B